MKKSTVLAVAIALAAGSAHTLMAHADHDSRYYDGTYNEYYDGNGHYDEAGQKKDDGSVQLGPRPFYLVQGMDEGKLKNRLLRCQDGPFYRTDFSIGHRGAALQFPEHSDVAYRAGARMGAGIVECDVTFTKDGELVCRHSECDLATTTNIVATPLNAKCTVPWTGPEQDPKPQCCTSDLTLAEFESLQPKMDASNPSATSAEGYLGGTASWRTDVYTGRAHVVTFKESIRLNRALGVKHTPELKSATHRGRLDDIFGSQEGYAQKFIDTLKGEGVNPKDVWAQSFNKDDILYWIQNEPAFGKQAVYLDSIDPTTNPPIPRLEYDELKDLKHQGVRIIAPPMWALLFVTGTGEVVPSEYAKDIRRAGLDIITWTFERADLRQGASKAGWDYQLDPQGKAIKKDSDMYKALDVLARQVGILGIFSDWPATVTNYANCNQSLHFVSAMSFLTAYALIFTSPVAAALVAMTSRQAGHFFFEPKGYDEVNGVTHEYKESIKVGYNLRRKVVLLSLWALSPLVLWLDPTLFGVFSTDPVRTGFVERMGLVWLWLGVAGLVFRTLHLFFLRGVDTGLVWMLKILTDPFHDLKLYHKAPLALLRGELIDPMAHAAARGH